MLIYRVKKKLKKKYSPEPELAPLHSASYLSMLVQGTMGSDASERDVDMGRRNFDKDSRPNSALSMS